ncbi:MAG: hypothetical protein GXX08_12620 [Firmicutes bacterium]|nr:hypothetical protein [Bacillota bacterium]
MAGAENRRADYVQAWWRLVNWPEVERRLQLALCARAPLTLEQAITALPPRHRSS